ncbi:MAG: hypothetical protein AAF549_08960 [Pseudomonadota bacterium]
MYAAKFLISFLVAIFFAYLFCKILKRGQKFIKLVTTNNWASLISLIIFLPFWICLSFGFYNYSDMLPYLIILSIYSYAVTAFIIRFVIDIPWELSIFLTVCLLAINEFMFDAIKFISQEI